MPRISRQERQRVRARLLDSAARHFAEHGFSGANINRISLDAGCAKGTIYNYFPSKEALFGEILGGGSGETVRRYRAQAPEGGIREQLRVVVREDVALTRKSEPFVKVIIREILSGNPATRAAIEAGLRPLMVLVTELLGAAQQRGEVRADVPLPRLVTLFAMQMTMHYAEHWRSDGGWPSWDEVPPAVVDAFLDGMKAR
ncbi:MAG: TetR/AcrR family transcriptional regulator [Myxococcota bacterium]